MRGSWEEWEKLRWNTERRKRTVNIFMGWRLRSVHGTPGTAPQFGYI